MIDLPEEVQIQEFNNATLQFAEDVAFSVATFVQVPHDVAEGGPVQVSGWLENLFKSVAREEVFFEVAVGDASQVKPITTDEISEIELGLSRLERQDLTGACKEFASG